MGVGGIEEVVKTTGGDEIAKETEKSRGLGPEHPKGQPELEGSGLGMVGEGRSRTGGMEGLADFA